MTPLKVESDSEAPGSLGCGCGGQFQSIISRRKLAWESEKATAVAAASEENLARDLRDVCGGREEDARIRESNGADVAEVC